MGITVDLQEPMLGNIMETYTASRPFIPACRTTESKSTRDKCLSASLPACCSGAQEVLQFSPLRTKPKLHWNSQPNSEILFSGNPSTIIHMRSPYTGFLMNELSLYCRTFTCGRWGHVITQLPTWEKQHRLVESFRAVKSEMKGLNFRSSQSRWGKRF